MFVKRLALRELEAPAGLLAAVLFALNHAAIAGHEASVLQRRTKRRLVISQRLRDAVTHSAGLARETRTGDGRDHVELAFALGDLERLVDHHAQNRAREVGVAGLAVDRDVALAGLHPNAGNRVLALAGRVGAAELVDLLFARDGDVCSAGSLRNACDLAE